MSFRTNLRDSHFSTTYTYVLFICSFLSTTEYFQSTLLSKSHQINILQRANSVMQFVKAGSFRHQNLTSTREWISTVQCDVSVYIKKNYSKKLSELHIIQLNLLIETSNQENKYSFVLKAKSKSTEFLIKGF